MKLNLKLNRGIFGLALGMVISAPAQAAQDVIAQQSVAIDGSASARLARKIGFYVGVVNEPAPSLLSVNAGYNVTDYLRLSAGLGRISSSLSTTDSLGNSASIEGSATTLGAGARFMVPGWSLTPTVGLHAAHVFYSGTPMITLGGFDQNGGHVYVSGGLDYQSKGGFNLGLGINKSFKSEIGNSAYLNMGWFFDWLG